MHPKTDKDWSRTLAVLLDGLLLTADPEGLDRDLDHTREMLDRYSFWRAEMNGQIAMPIGQPVAAHGCNEEETE